jgi:hypothetical protein
MVLNPFNMLSADMVRFYFYANASVTAEVYQYPAFPVDTYTPDFNMTELINQCTTNGVRYLVVDEYGQNATIPSKSYHYFGSNWTFYSFNQTLMSTGRFRYEPVSFWEEPARVFVLSFS